MRRRSFASLCSLAAIGAAATSVGACTHKRPTLKVFAAASLTEAFTAFGTAFEREYPERDVVVQFAGSHILAAQIEQGAPADVFASADPIQATRLVEAGLAHNAVVFAHNELVVVLGPDAPNITSVEQLGEAQLDLVLADPAVPAGRYTEFVLGTLQPAAADRVRANVRSYELDVRGVMMKVAVGEADAAIVYRTDLRDPAGKNLRSFPTAVQPNIAYVAVTLGKGSSAEPARTFVNSLRRATATELLTAHGFTTPRPRG